MVPTGKQVSDWPLGNHETRSLWIQNNIMFLERKIAERRKLDYFLCCERYERWLLLVLRRRRRQSRRVIHLNCWTGQRKADTNVPLWQDIIGRHWRTAEMHSRFQSMDPLFSIVEQKWKMSPDCKWFFKETTWSHEMCLMVVVLPARCGAARLTGPGCLVHPAWQLIVSWWIKCVSRLRIYPDASKANLQRLIGRDFEDTSSSVISSVR